MGNEATRLLPLIETKAIHVTRRVPISAGLGCAALPLAACGASVGRSMAIEVAREPAWLYLACWTPYKRGRRRV